jgi:hypothetical protein
MFQTDFEIIKIMSRGDLEGTCSEFDIHVGVANQGDLSAQNG